jgi:hypothetical protein
MPMAMKNQKVHRLVDQMSQNATRDDVKHESYVREAIESGLSDSREGRTRDVHVVREKYGLPA